MINKSWAEQIIENQKKLDALSEIANALRQEIESEKAKQPMRYKGSVATVSALPASGNEIGDMRNVEETGNNYAWDGEKWEAMSGVLSLPVATTTMAGISKLGNGTVITNGGGVGVNASGQLIIAQGTTSAYGVFKLGNGTIVTTGAGIGVNASGQLFVAQGDVNTPGVFKLGTSVQVADSSAGMVGLTASGALAVRFATDTNGGVVKTGGNGVGTNNNVLTLNLRTSYSGFEFANKSLYINCAEQTEHPEAGTAASVAFDTNGRLVVLDASTTRKGGVKLATSADDTGTTSVLIAAQVKSLLAGKANNTELTTLTGRVETLETNAGSYATNEALQGIVESCNAAIAGKADASSLASLEARVAALESA